MAERVSSRPNGRQSKYPTTAPERLGQYIQPKPNGNNQYFESGSTGPIISAGHSSSSLAPLRRLATQRPPVPRLRSPPSVKIAPIRRMAPQHETAKRPAWQEPLLKSPAYRQERKAAFVTSQTSLFPFILSGPEGEVDQSVARPRELKFVPPVTGPPPSSRSSPVKQLPTAIKAITDIPPRTPPKDSNPIHYTVLAPPAPVHPPLQIGPQSPFQALAPQITPNKPLPPLPQLNASKFFTRLPQNTALAELHPRQYRPRTPPPSSLVSQPLMAAACRSASVPAFLRVGEESWAIRPLTAKDFQSLPTNEAKYAATEDALTPVKFVDYTQIASFPYTKFPKGVEGNLREILPLEASTPFGPHQAKAFVLKLLPALQYLNDNHIATPAEALAHTELTQTTEDWLLSTEVTRWPKFAGAHYGQLLFDQAKSLNNNWFVVSGLPKFLWGKWTLPCTEIRGRRLGWEWYLTVQDVFFRGVLEAYTEALRENFVVVGEVAYPMNTIVPRSTDSEMSGGVA